MTNIFYMSFGIFLFVLGSMHEVIMECVSTYLKQLLEKHKESVPKEKPSTANAPLEKPLSLSEVEDKYYNDGVEYVDMPLNASESPVNDLYEERIKTYDNVSKTSPTPPQSEESVLFDYVPMLHDVDVEIMTSEREKELYNRAVTGGVL